ncbi:hypothetical protein Tco_0410536 [Tanacetum coccineum]
MSTPSHFDIEIISHTDEAQSSRVPTHLPDDFHLIVGHDYTPATVDTESEPEEAPSKIEEFQPLVSRAPLIDEEFEVSKPSDTRITSSHSLASSDSTTLLLPDQPFTQTSPTPTPTRVLFHRRTARMATRTQPTLSLGMSAQIAKATALSPSSFRKRYISSYETPSPSSSLTLPIRKRYQGTSKLVENTMDESSDSNAEREGSEDEGHADKPLRLGCGALRCHELTLGEGSVPSTFEIGQSYRSMSEQQRVEETPTPRPRTPPSLEWSSDSLPVSPSSLVVPTPIASPVTTPTATIAVDEDEFLEEQERATVTFGALWRPVLALEAWAGHVDARRAEMWHDRYDDHKLIHDMLVQHVAIERELQEMRGRVSTLKQERSRREQ